MSVAATCAYIRNDLFALGARLLCFSAVGVPAGTFSSKLVDGAGITFVCELCPEGTKQPSGASVECVPCKEGEYQDVKGSISCKRCGLANYQDQTGTLYSNSLAVDPPIQKFNFEVHLIYCVKVNKKLKSDVRVH